MRLLCLFAVVLVLAQPTPGQEPAVLKGFGGWVGALAFSPDGTHLAIGAGDGTISLLNVRDRRKVADLAEHKDAVAALAFLDSDRVVSGGHDKAIMIHALTGKKPIKHEYRLLHHGAVLTLAVIPKTDRFLSSGIDRTIHEWEASKKTPARSAVYHTSWVNGLAVDAAGKRMASGSSDNSIKVMNLADKRGVGDVFFTKHGEVRSVAFAPDGKLLAAGIRYGWVSVWNLDEKKEVFSSRVHAGETWSVVFSPDGKALLTGGGDWNKPGEVRLFSVGAWKEERVLKTPGEVLALAISGDGRRLAAGTWNRTVSLWELSAPP